MNKEIFVDSTVLWLINSSDDYKVTDGSETSNGDYREALQELNVNDNKKNEKNDVLPGDQLDIVLPGTKEYLKLAENIEMPRKDGIHYLLKAAESISEKEILADIQHKVGDIYVWAGSNKQAYPYYVKSVDLAPGNANTRLQLIDAGLAIYKNKATLEQLNYLYDSGQINFPKRMLMTEMTMYAGQFDRSKKILDEARLIHPFNHDTFAEMNARIKLLANKPDEAIAAYKAYVTDSYPSGFDSEYMINGTDAYYTIARLYAGKKNNTQAFIWLKKAISNGFNYSYILELDPLMSELRKKPEWEKLVLKPMKTKLKQKGLLFDY